MKDFTQALKGDVDVSWQATFDLHIVRVRQPDNRMREKAHGSSTWTPHAVPNSKAIIKKLAGLKWTPWSDLMTTLEYFVNLIVYEFLLLICGAPLAALFLKLPDAVPEGLLRIALNTVLVVYVLGWLFGGSWVAHTASRRRVFENDGFFEALRSTLAEAQIYMAFMPLVGSIFQPPRLKQSQFEKSDDDRFE